ncbi:hypothetical protein BDZ94DRAFT_1261684 [Collybia nuda]|uniref:HIT-type domain-containing protein n=1 Tax=Collybia nuda TaxID=64659 RepID=A0A9P5Y508_9AGAR|nr:hypothetical protein BDZ94DRAFT_1261684 [Collybia nuda]
MAPKKSKKPKCQVCSTNDSKYTCAGCLIVYCSVLCYKQHKANECGGGGQPAAGTSVTGTGGADPTVDTTGASTNASADIEVDADTRTGTPTQATIPVSDSPIQTNTTANADPQAGPSDADHSKQVFGRLGEGDGNGREMDEDDDGGPPLEDPPPLRSLASLNWPYVPEESAYPDPLKRDDPKTLQLHQYEAIATSPSIRKALNSHPNLIPLLTSIDALRGPERERALERALGVAAPDIANREGPVEIGEDVLALRELAEAVEAAVRGENRAALGLDWGMGDE